MNVCYVGPIRDHSGYGETSRHHVAALTKAGVDITVKPLQYTFDSSDFGKFGQIAEDLVGRQIDYRIKLLHTTPDQFTNLAERGKYNIGFMYWETDRIPQEFADGLNHCNEVWTGSQANVDAIRAAGVGVPVHVFPQPMDTERNFGTPPFKIAGFDGYMFYSIFEWIERKNPRALLEAYWREFQKGENVGLLIKTYHRNFTAGNKKLISDQVSAIKQASGLKYFPPVFLYKELMNRDQIERLHVTGNAFVSAHRGEGWGLPQGEALLAGKPVISTGYSGIHEYLESEKSAYLVDYTMTRVEGMDGFARWYTPDQNWAEPSVDDLRRFMRYCYENPEAVAEVGAAGRQVAKDKFALSVVGQAMADRLTEIEKGL